MFHSWSICLHLYSFCWRSRDEPIRNVLLWIPTHGRAKAGRPARTYIMQRCEDTGCCPEDLPRAMNDREEWRERVRDIRATSAIWWWWIFTEHTVSVFSQIHERYIPWRPFVESLGSVYYPISLFLYCIINHLRTPRMWHKTKFGLVWFGFMAYQPL